MIPLVLTGLAGLEVLANVLQRELPGIRHRLGNHRSVNGEKIVAVYDTVTALLDDLPDDVDTRAVREQLHFVRLGVAAVARERLNDDDERERI